MSQNTNPGETLIRTTGRHVIVGRLVALDELAGEVVVRTGQNKKVTCTHVSPALMEALATKMLQTVCLVGFGTWGGNGGLSDFRPVQVLEFDEGLVDPAFEDAPAPAPTGAAGLPVSPCDSCGVKDCDKRDEAKASDTFISDCSEFVEAR